MLGNKLFENLVRNTARKGYDASSGRVEDIYQLSQREIDSILPSGCDLSRYGFKYKGEALDAIYRILRNSSRVEDGESTDYVDCSILGGGDVLTIADKDGARISLMYIGDLQFVVLEEEYCTLLYGDMLQILQVSITKGRDLTARCLTSIGEMYPDQESYFHMDSISSLRVLRNSAVVGVSKLASESVKDANVTTECYFVTSYQDHFHQLHATTDVETALFKVDLVDKTFIPNPDINPERWSVEGLVDVIREICGMCDCEGVVDNLYLGIEVLQPGMVRVTYDMSGEIVLEISSKPIIKQRTVNAQ